MLDFHHRNQHFCPHPIVLQDKEKRDILRLEQMSSVDSTCRVACKPCRMIEGMKRTYPIERNGVYMKIGALRTT